MILDESFSLFPLKVRIIYFSKEVPAISLLTFCKDKRKMHRCASLLVITLACFNGEKHSTVCKLHLEACNNTLGL